MKKKLKNWLDRGLLTEEKYQELINDYEIQKQEKMKKSMQITLYSIGAVLLGLGIIFLITSNGWYLEIFNNLANFFTAVYEFTAKLLPPEFLIISVIFCTIVFCLLKGHELFYIKHKSENLGQALIFLSTILVGALIIYIELFSGLRINYYPTYFIWWLIIYPIAFIYKNKAINILSVALLTYSVINYETLYEEHISNIVIAALGVFYCILGNIPIIKEKYQGFSTTYKFYSLIVIYLFLLCSIFNDGDGEETILFVKTIIPFAVLFILNFIIYFSNKEKTKLLDFETILTGAFCLFIPLFFIPNKIFLIPVLANIFLITIIGGIYYFGHKFGYKRLVGLMNKFTVFYILIFYLRYSQEHLEGAIAFIIGGIILICGGYFLEKTTKKILEKRD